MLPISNSPEPDNYLEDETPRGGRVISRLLASAVSLWVRSQLEEVSDLFLQINSSNTQLLSGYIPEIAVSAQKAIYQGLHLSQIALNGRNIRANLGQVVRGKPLRLLETIAVNGYVQLEEEGLNASLQSPLLATALSELLQSWLLTERTNAPLIAVASGQVRSLRVLPDQLEFHIHPAPLAHPQDLVSLKTRLRLLSPHQLSLSDPQFINSPHLESTVAQLTDDYCIDLGDSVWLEELSVHEGLIACRGEIKIIPVE